MPTPRPNLLWIFCDQLRAQALSCNGDPNISTPHIDRLARESGGVNFSLACSQYPICSPFRAGLITGTYAHINGLRVHGDLLPPDRRTIAHAFINSGYRTSWYGKWHMASVQGVLGWKAGADYWVHPLLRGGFQDWCGFDCSNHYYNTRYSRGTQIDPPIKLEGYQTDALTTLSLEYLNTTARDLNRAGTPPQPWFHVLSVEAPHPGTDLDGSFGNPAPPQYTARFDPAKLILRGNVPPAEQPAARQRLAGYYAQIANLDDNVGRILKWLDDSGQADNTLVCFFSDHGEMGGSHGLYEKNDVFEESIRIPVLMRLRPQPPRRPPRLGHHRLPPLPLHRQPIQGPSSLHDRTVPWSSAGTPLTLCTSVQPPECSIWLRRRGASTPWYEKNRLSTCLACLFPAWDRKRQRPQANLIFACGPKTIRRLVRDVNLILVF